MKPADLEKGLENLNLKSLSSLLGKIEKIDLLQKGLYGIIIITWLLRILTL